VVLLVENDPVQRLSTAEHLRAEGYDVRDVAAAADALPLLDAAAVLVVDLLMPGLDGVGLLSVVRERGLAPAVVVTTALPDPLPALPVPARVLRKPFHAAELAAVVRELAPGEGGAS
jgi:DNA-binding response OmpR family regulator